MWSTVAANWVMRVQSEFLWYADVTDVQYTLYKSRDSRLAIIKQMSGAHFTEAKTTIIAVFRRDSWSLHTGVCLPLWMAGQSP